MSAASTDPDMDKQPVGAASSAIQVQTRAPGTNGGRILQTERDKASFGVDALASYIYGEAHLSRMKRVLAVVENDRCFAKTEIPYMSRREKFEHGLRKEKRLAQLIIEQGWDEDDRRMAELLIDMSSVFRLHRDMWVKTIRDQGNEEQHKLFLEPSMSYDIIGCYSQTELGHGSNVQGLETTATYIVEDQEFEIHSPTLTAAKWWSGGLGRAATHSCVMAQLVIKGKKYGPHPFVVPLRDPKTRKPLPGRKVGDVGPKVGLNMIDNGYLLLDRVRIPYNHFLAKYSQINKETGEYSKPGHDKLAYGTMTYIRAGIVQSARDVIARAATIAIRYCAIRRQFADKDAPRTEDKKPVETQVLDYSMVQYRLFPILAQAYAFHFTGKAMLKLYTENMARLAKDDFSLLADTHAFSSALKSLSTITAAQALEDCRRACGGHGYSLSAGIGSQYAEYLPQVTWEGDSYMLTGQVSNFLMKTFRTLYADRDKLEVSQDDSITVRYIKDYLMAPERKASVKFSGDFHSLDFYLDAFGFRTAYLIGQLVKKRDIQRRSWNGLLIDMFKVSKAHAQYHLVYFFANALRNDEELRSQPALYHIMQTVFELFACYTMEQEVGEFMLSDYLSSQQAGMLRPQVDALLAEIRPQAVALVDSFKLPDYLLDSALGRNDGNVYQAIFDFALKEPINQVTWNTDIHALDTPLMSSAPEAKL